MEFIGNIGTEKSSAHVISNRCPLCRKTETAHGYGRIQCFDCDADMPIHAWNRANRRIAKIERKLRKVIR